jgi:regulator of replication initiation timing
MDYDELLQKFNLLLNENNRLIKENSRLRAQLGLGESELIQHTDSANSTETDIPDDESACRNCFSGVNGKSDPLAKIRLFMSLFRGRDDVYAKRWENKKGNFRDGELPGRTLSELEGRNLRELEGRTLIIQGNLRDVRFSGVSLGSDQGNLL